MKKLLAIALALVLALSMATVAFAANAQRTEPETVTENNGTADAEVWVLIDEGTLPEDPEDVDPEGDDVVYSVSIDATAADFTYTFDKDYDAATHKYKGGTWNKESANIVVTNDSNTKVGISAAWKTEAGVTIDGLSATRNDVKVTQVQLSTRLHKVARASRWAKSSTPTTTVTQ